MTMQDLAELLLKIETQQGNVHSYVDTRQVKANSLKLKSDSQI
jgi:hypothetical protein